MESKKQNKAKQRLIDKEKRLVVARGQGHEDSCKCDRYILECEVKWASESITMNKASGGDAIPVELFQILEDDAMKVLHSICQQFGKLSSGHRTGKGQFSFQS